MDEPILKTPGELLAEARAAASLTLTQLAEITKIPVRQLESIERDEYHKLSGPLYVKSFLRAYAEAVGVEAAIVLDLYARSSGEGRGAGGAATGSDVWVEDKVRITRVGLPWSRLGLVAAVVVLGVVALWLLTRALVGGGGDTTPATGPAAESAAPDTTLTTPEDTALGVAVSPTPADAAGAGTSADEPGEVATRPPATGPETRPHPAADDSLARSFGRVPPPVGATVPDRRALPAAVGGADPGLRIGGRDWPLRLRLLARSPVAMSVSTDAAGEVAVTTVPRETAGLPPLPGAGVEPGRAYAVREGVVAYWGAVEYFEIGLDRTDGVEITLNGAPHDVAGLAPGATRMLHRNLLGTESRR